MMHSSRSASRFVLTIERGQTRFRQRPIDEDRFLIGAGSNCHLQLGGDIPILHSIIVPEGDHLWIDAVVPAPPLILNGQVVREAELRSGDVLEINGFVFAVSAQRPAVEASLDEVAANESAAMPTSAVELVEAIEQELAAITQVELGRRRGAEALLQAAARVKKADHAAQHPAPLPAGWEQTLSQAISDLKARAEALDAREEQLRENARQLEQTQMELERQLQVACERLDGQTGQNPLRMTA